jgi:hypothetical protein
MRRNRFDALPASVAIRWVVGAGVAQVAMILAVLRLFPSDHL